MKHYIYIGIGGFLGSILRFLCKNYNLFCINTYNLFINTLIINILGSFLLAFILMSSIKVFKSNLCLKQGIAVGLLGSFTTFSTFCKDAVDIYLNKNINTFTMYLILSIIGGIIAACLGNLCSDFINNKLYINDNEIV